MAPSPSTPAQRARGCRQAGSHITPDTPETKPLSGEKDNSKKSKRTLSEVGTSPAKKAKVEPQQIEPQAGANSTEPPATEANIEIEPPAGANSTEPPATEAKIENAEQPGDNMHLQSVTPAGANLPTPPQLPQSPASDGARTVIDDLEDTQVSQDSQVSQCEATDKSDSKVSKCEVADKLDKRKKHSHGSDTKLAGRFIKRKWGASGSWYLQFSVFVGPSSGSSDDYERSLEGVNPKDQQIASVQ
jgi:hypothetical protein